MIPAAASGVRSPSTSRTPAPTSVRLASQACRRPGFIPRLSNQRPVPAILPPPKMWLRPCASITAAAARRRPKQHEVDRVALDHGRCSWRRAVRRGTTSRQLGDDPDVRVLPDRGVGIGVDGEDGSRGAHTDGVVELPRQADGDVEAGRDAAAGDADLARSWLPSLVGDLAGGRQLGAEHVEQRLQLRVVLGRDARADTHHPLRRSRARSTSSSRVGRGDPDTLARLRGDDRRPDRRDRRPRAAGRGSTPARTVAIWIASWRRWRPRDDHRTRASTPRAGPRRCSRPG